MYYNRKLEYQKRLTNANRTPGSKRVRRKTNFDPLDNMFSDSESEDDVYKHKQKKSDTSNSIRIIFATRTHTQLTQFLEELRKTSFSPPEVLSSTPPLKIGVVSSEEIPNLPLSVMLFGSRKQFCVNDQVRNLQSSAAISERCRELTEAPEQTTAAKRKRSSNRCAYKNQEAEEILRDKALVQMHSIEELAETGKTMGACPYFATRAALETGDVDVIGVPYSAILHQPTRESLGITVDNNTVVVFDEAHNIVNTVCDLHSAQLTRPALSQTIAALKAYIERYESRFTARNLFHLRQLVTLAQGILRLLPSRARSAENARVVRPRDILFDAGVDNINMYALVAYLQESKLCKKLRGFVDTGEALSGKQTKKQTAKKRGERTEEDLAIQRSAKQSVNAFENFLRCLADCADYGRIAIYPFTAPKTDKRKDEALPFDLTARLKYFVVEPGTLFANAMKDARSILLVGGTLSPRSIIKERLLKGLDKEVVEFECDHVVPKENVMTRVCGVGPSGKVLEFTYKTRKSFEVCDELGLATEECIKNVPGGVVMFFSSYDLMRHTLGRWKVSGCLQRLKSIKAVLAEERGSNDVFKEYQACINRDAKRGALLTAVMGGKLSEGINFSDDLGRLVIMVGMPFANAMQVETSEVLKPMSGSRRSEFLENACLTVVNQCIGRAVRHRTDYASIVLMDRRYAQTRVESKLPRFVRRDVAVVTGFARLLEDFEAFFARKR